MVISHSFPFFHPYVSFFFSFFFFSLGFFSTTQVSHYLHLPFFSFSSSFRITCVVASRTISPFLPLCFFPFLLHTHTQIYLPLSHTNKFSLIHTYITGKSTFYTNRRSTCFFFGSGLISFILLLRFH